MGFGIRDANPVDLDTAKLWATLPLRDLETLLYTERGERYDRLYALIREREGKLRESPLRHRSEPKVGGRRLILNLI